MAKKRRLCLSSLVLFCFLFYCVLFCFCDFISFHFISFHYITFLCLIVQLTVSEALSSLLSRPVTFLDDCVGEAVEKHCAALKVSFISFLTLPYRAHLSCSGRRCCSSRKFAISCRGGRKGEGRRGQCCQGHS